jgi:2-C-methyl-D-erythritol 2,4-cyclodiphosphate synthase
LPPESSKPCLIGGIIFEEMPGLDAESDGDVVFHALCNAITSLTGVPILSGIARELCRKDGITDSQVYLERALETLERQNLVHVAVSIEAKRPRIEDQIDRMRRQIARVLELRETQVGITAISGDGLTDFGCGDGVQAFALVTTSVDIEQ